MKRLLIVPLVVLAAATVAPAASANHGAGQTPDLEPQDQHCRVEFVGHATCRVTTATPDGPKSLNRDVSPVPTEDGWHTVFEIGIIDNDSDTVLKRLIIDGTIPFIDPDPFGIGVPIANRPVWTNTSGTGGGVPTTDATCFMNIEVGVGGEHICTFDPFDLELPILPL